MERKRKRVLKTVSLTVDLAAKMQTSMKCSLRSAPCSPQYARNRKGLYKD